VPVRQQDAAVLEEDDAIAEQAPALLGVCDRDVGRSAVVVGG